MNNINPLGSIQEPSKGPDDNKYADLHLDSPPQSLGPKNNAALPISTKALEGKGGSALREALGRVVSGEIPISGVLSAFDSSYAKLLDAAKIAGPDAQGVDEIIYHAVLNALKVAVQNTIGQAKAV